MRFFDKKQSNKFSQLISCRVQAATKLHISTSFTLSQTFLSKQNTVGINTEVFFDLLTTNVNSYFRCFSLLMMTFSVNTVDYSEFIFFRGKQHLMRAYKTNAFCKTMFVRFFFFFFFFFLTKRIKIGKK